jgi:hypothetical protein
MKNRNNAVLTWLRGLNLQTNDHSRDEISSARILKLIEQKVDFAERKKRRWLKGFGIGAIFVLSTVSVAGALIRADRQRGTSAVGAVCWMGRMRRQMRYRLAAIFHRRTDVQLFGPHFESTRLLPVNCTHVFLPVASYMSLRRLKVAILGT